MSSQDQPIGMLSVDIFLSITEHLDQLSLNRLPRVCKDFHRLLQPTVRKAARAHALPSEEQYKLLNAFQNMDLEDWQGPIPSRPRENLVQAIELSRCRVVESYLMSGVDPNSYSISGERMLNLAIFKSDGRIAEILLRYGANPSLPNSEGKKPPILCAASRVRTARYCPDTMITRLVEAGADLSPQGIIHTIIHCCQARTVQLAVEHGADLYQKYRMGWSTLHWVNDMGTLNYILRKTGTDLLPAVDNSDETALFSIIREGDEPLALALYSAYLSFGNMDLLNKLSRAYVHTGETPLHHAITMRLPNLATEMINSGVILLNQNAYTGTALHIAIKSGLLPVVRLLVSKGVDVNIRDAQGRTALALAAWLNVPSVVRILVEDGRADLDMGVNGVIPLDCAYTEGYDEVVEILRNHSRDWTPDNVDPDASTRFAQGLLDNAQAHSSTH